MLTPNEIEFVKRVHQRILEYIEKGKEKGFNDLATIDYILSDIDFSIDEPHDFQEMENFIDLYMSNSVNTISTNFYNQLYSGFSPMGYVGEAITGLTNNSMYTKEMSPAATLMEQSLIQKMSNLIGYENGFGTFVPGGSNANLIAMLCARERAIPRSREKGLFNSSTLVAFISEEAHYSFLKAGYQIGIGLDNIIRVPCDINGRMDVKELEKMITISIEKGDVPFFVGATAGTTVRGVFDPINKIANLSEKYKLWFHIDGSWGGSTLLSKRHSHLVKGSEHSDSFSWCAHKMMGVPISCTALITKQHDFLKEINCVEGTDYLFHGNENEQTDLGLYSFQCGRRVDALKLWLAWKHVGDEGYEKKINHLFTMANYAEKKVRNSEMLGLVSPVESLNICFRIQHNKFGNDEWDELTKKVRDKMIKDGRIMVNHAEIDGLSCIRLITVNFNLSEEDIDYFFNQVEDSTTEFVNEKFN